MTAPVSAVERPGYVRPTWREALAEYLPPRWRGPAADRWIDRLPIVPVLAVHTALSLPLHNTVAAPELAAIRLGRAQLAAWFGAGPPVTGSATPVTHPVIAATLDAVGGLSLVRWVSLLAMLATIVALHSTVEAATASRRMALFTACAFALSAATVFAGALGTSDALCLLALTLAVRAGVTGRTLAGAVGCGAALAAAVALDHAAVLYLPLAVSIMVIASGGGRPVHRRRRTRWRPIGAWQAAVVALVVCVAVVAAVQAATGNGLIATLRQVRFDGPPAPAALGRIGIDMGILVLLAVAGAVGCRLPALQRVDLLLAGALPLVALPAGAPIAVDRAGGFLALMTAPLAGLALARLSRSLLRLIPVVVILLLAIVPAGSRSAWMFRGWVDVTPALTYLRAVPPVGRYLATSADELGHHLGRTPAATFEPAESLLARGTTAVEDAIGQRRYDVVLLAPGHPVLEDAVKQSADYEPDGDQARRGVQEDEWAIYRLVNTFP